MSRFNVARSETRVVPRRYSHPGHEPPKEEAEEMHDLWCKEAKLGKKAKKVCDLYFKRRARENAPL